MSGLKGWIEDYGQSNKIAGTLSFSSFCHTAVGCIDSFVPNQSPQRWPVSAAQCRYETKQDTIHLVINLEPGRSQVENWTCSLLYSVDRLPWARWVDITWLPRLWNAPRTLILLSICGTTLMLFGSTFLRQCNRYKFQMVILKHFQTHASWNKTDVIDSVQ